MKKKMKIGEKTVTEEHDVGDAARQGTVSVPIQQVFSSFLVTVMLNLYFFTEYSILFHNIYS